MSTKPVTAVTIRAARADDAGYIHRALLGIAVAVNERDRMTSTPADIIRFGFGERPAFATLIAEVGGEPAGLCIHFPSFSTWQGRPGGYVQDLFVEEKFRKHGIGARLIERAAADIRTAGGCYMRLAVDTRNFAAQAFYERLGIVHSDTEQIHAAYGEAFDRLSVAGAAATKAEQT